jgi:hypothetical protein
MVFSVESFVDGGQYLLNESLGWRELIEILGFEEEYWWIQN